MSEDPRRPDAFLPCAASVAALVVVALVVSCAPPEGRAEPGDAPDWGGPAPVRSQFSFDLPHLDLTPASARLLPRGGSELSVQLVHSNIFEITPDYETRREELEAGMSVPDWEYVADGEITRVAVRFEHAVSRRIQLGIEVPAQLHSSGFLDGTIASVHDALGLPQNDRERRPEDELRHEILAGDSRFLLEESGASLGDVVLRAKLGVVETARAAFAVVLETSLPTGEGDALAGADGAEHGLTILLSAGGERHAFHGGLGHFLLDTVEGWPVEVEDRTAAFAGYEWRGARWSFVTHVAAATSILPEAPGRHHDEVRAEVVVAGRRSGRLLGGAPWSLDFGFVENLTTNDNAADLGVFVTSRWLFGAGGVATGAR